jgi:hypothetical protein
VSTALGDLFVFLPRQNKLPAIGVDITLSFDPESVCIVK